MIQATEEYKAKVAELSRQWDARVQFKDGTTWRTLLRNSDLKSVKMKKGVRSGGEFCIGMQYIPTMEIVVARLDYDLMGRAVRFQLSPVYGETRREFITIATGKVTSIAKTNDEVTISAVGYLLADGSSYSTENMASTPIEELQRVAAKIGTTVRLLHGTELLNVTTDAFYPLEGRSTRDFFKAVAGYIGGFVTEDADGQILLGYVNDYYNAFTVLNDTLQRPPIINGSLTVDSFWVTVTSSEGTEGRRFVSGATSPVFNYATPYMDYDMFNGVRASVEDMQFVAFTANQVVGNPLIEPWDPLKLEDGSLTTYPEITVLYDGGLTCDFFSAFAANTELAGMTAGPLTKQVGSIAQAVKEFQYFWTDGNGAHITQTPKEEFISNPQGGNALMDSRGFHVRDGAEDVAKFTDSGTQIGKDDESRAVFDANSMSYLNSDGDTDFYMSRVGKVGVPYSTSKTQRLTTGTMQINLDPKANLNYGECVVALYGGQIAIYATFDGTHDSLLFNNEFGRGSIDFTGDETASNPGEGNIIFVNVTTAGTKTIEKVGVSYYAEGSAPVLEFGDSKAVGAYSTAFGMGTTASSAGQTVVGRYNKPDTIGNQVFTVGSGTDEGQQNAIEAYDDGTVHFPQWISGLFAITTEEVDVGPIAPKSQSMWQSQEVTPPDGPFVPVGVVGINCHSSKLIPVGFKVTSLSEYSPDNSYFVMCRFENTTSATSDDFTVECTILWLRASGKIVY